MGGEVEHERRGEKRGQRRKEGIPDLGGRLAPPLLPVLRRLEVHFGMAVKRHDRSTAWLLVSIKMESILLSPHILPPCFHDYRYLEPGASKWPFLCWFALWRLNVLIVIDQNRNYSHTTRWPFNLGKSPALGETAPGFLNFQWYLLS